MGMVMVELINHIVISNMGSSNVRFEIVVYAYSFIRLPFPVPVAQRVGVKLSVFRT